MQRGQPILHLERGAVVAAQTSLLHLRAFARGDVRRDRDATITAMRHDAQRCHVLTGELDEIGTQMVALQRRSRQIAGRILHAGDILQLEKALHRLDRDIHHRARRNVVDDDRDADGVVDRLEMMVKALLVRLVVIGRNDQDAVRTGLFRVLRQLHRLVRVVRAGTGDDRHAALRLADANLDDAAVLLVG